MQVVAEEGRLDVFAELARGLVSSERDEPDTVSLRSLPLAVEPWAGHDEVRALRIILFRMVKDLPRAPGILLIPESSDVQVRDGRGMELIHPCFFLPEFVVVRVIDGRVPVRNRAVKIFRVDVGERAEIEIPLVGVIYLEVEVGVLVLVGLLHNGVFEVIAFAQCAVAMIIVVHPLIDGRGLLADRLERGMRMEQCQRCREAIVGDAIHSDFAVIVGNILHQPLDRIVGVGRFVRRLGIVRVDPRRKVEHSLGLEASAQVLDHKDVAILG